MAWWDDLNNQAMQAAQGGADQSWDSYFKRQKIQELADQRKKKTTATTTQPQTKSGGISDWYSTIGGTLGALGGGAAAGAAAGSIVPGAGTAVGAGIGLLGAILGGALGSGAGKVAENAQEGEKDVWKDVGNEALLGGVTSVGPVRGVNAVLKGGKALATGAGTKGTLEALGKATTETPIRDALGGITRKASDNLVSKGLRLTPSQQFNYQERYGESAPETLRRLNLIGADSNAINTARQGLDGQFSGIISLAPNVSKSNLMKNVTGAANDLRSAGPADLKHAADNLVAEAEAVFAKYGDDIPASEVNKLRRSYDSLVNYTAKQTDPNRYSVNKRMADTLRTTLQSTADDAGLNAGGQTLKEVGMDISRLRKLRDLSAKQEQLGSGSQRLGLSDLLAGGVGGAVGGLATGGAGSMAGALGTMAAVRALNSRTANRKGAKVLDRVTGRAGGGNAVAEAENIGLNPLGIAGRFGALGTLENAMNGSSAQQQPAPELDELGLAPDDYETLNQALVAEGISPNVVGAGASGAASESSNPFGVSIKEVGAQMKNALAQGDTKTYQALADLYDRIYEYESTESKDRASQKPLSQFQQERADLIKALGMTQSAVDGGSIEYGPIGAAINNVKALFNSADPETLAYKNTVSGLRAAITKARAGTSLTEGEKALLAQYTPSDTDSEQVVRSKLKQLQALYGSTAPTGGGTSLEDLLVNYQR